MTLMEVMAHGAMGLALLGALVVIEVTEGIRLRRRRPRRR